MPPFSREVHLIERPVGLPNETQFKIVSTVVPDVGVGEILVKNLYMSVDPYMRPRLSAQTELDTPMTGAAIGRVAQSRHSGFSEGDYVVSACGFREYFLATGSNALQAVRKLDPDGMPLTTYLGPLGNTGITAYGGLLVIGAMQDGERVFVSAAAGAVGSTAVQIAKIKGCHVVGSAGSNEKCEWIKNELRADAVINYKKENIHEALKTAAPDGIDVYFENVGSEHLNAALANMRALGRIPVCGMISSYNNEGTLSDPITALFRMIYGRITMRGFVSYEFESLRPRFLDDMKGWIRQGKMKYRETIVVGIEHAPAALIGLFKGDNIGKMIVQLAAE
ncbi:MAG TPA: NADP-dependent oxidoreductase [Steroidobacteraceae bacterium]|nr:NADP-dependent oxidoreductase [Steroidobacteraceae bacterium]